MYKKILIQAGLFISLYVFAVSTAQADFRKALEALQNRDGAAMLAEIRSAVEKQNDAGLLLFLNALAIDEYTSQRATIKEKLDAEIVQSKSVSTFEIILTEQQQMECKRLLQIAVKNGSTDAQLRLLLMPKFTDRSKINWNNEFDKLANGGSYFAAARLTETYSYPPSYSKEKAEYWFTKTAELGDPEYVFGLAMKYLHYATPYGLSHEQCSPAFEPKRVCFDKNEDKGFLWLGKAVRSMDEHPELIRRFAHEMGNIYLTKFDTRLPERRYRGKERT